MQSVREPSFIQGVSRQPDTQRLPGTAREIQNSYVDLVTGLSKRHGTEFKHILTGLSNPTHNYDVHWILTGGLEFVMLLSDDAAEPIQVYALADGRKVAVAYGAGTLAYVTSGSLVDRLRILSVFDSTIIANNEVTVALTGAAETYNVLDANVELDFTELPLVPVATTKYKTLNSSVGRPAGYYEAKDPFDTDNVDPYTRLKSPAANSEFDADTMPVQMIYDSTANSGDGQFDLVQPDWGERLSGDEVTNPGPSFVGRQITDMVFHKSRLWFFADEVMSASQAVSFFNFWLNDIYAQNNGDPIDEFVTDKGLNKIKYAVPFNKALNLFTEGNRQFEIRSSGPMAPDSIDIIPTTSYGVSDAVRPIGLGSQLYFFTGHTSYGQMFEYYQLDSAANNVAEDISEHVKGYITEEITKISGEVNNGLILSHGSDTRTVYPYKMTWRANKKIQSAWSKWLYPDNDYTIQSSEVFGDDIWYLMYTAGDTTPKFVLVSQKVAQAESDEDLTYNIHLDFFARFPTATAAGTYSAVTNTTYWDLSYNANGVDVVCVPTSGAKAGMSLTTTVTEQSEHVSRVSVVGDLSATDVTIGLPFEWSTTLNRPYFKDDNGTPITGSFSIKKLILYIKDTVQFDLTQAVPGITTPYTARYTAAQMSSDSVPYNTVPIVAFDDPSFVVLGKANNMTITISDTSEFPATLVSAEFRGTFNKRRPVR